MKTITRSHLRKDLFYTFDIETTTLITGLDEKNHPIRNAIIWSGQFYDGKEYIQTRSLADTIKRLKLIEEYNKDNPLLRIFLILSKYFVLLQEKLYQLKLIRLFSDAATFCLTSL